MNVTTYLMLLSGQAKDATGAVFSDAVLKQFMASAVRAYSRYRALKRRFGEGGLALNVAALATEITVVGGPFAAGDTIIVDAYQPWAETVTVSAVTQVDPALTPILVGTPLVLTVSALGSAHYAGAVVARVPLGLTIPDGATQVAMPGDFMAIDQDSWGMATGARRARKKFESFYDGVYRFSGPIQGVGAGQAQNFAAGGGAGNSGPSLLSDGYNLTVPGLSAGYTFSEGQTIILNVSPATTSDVSLNPTYYWALHQPETIPDADMDALLDLGMYYALMGNASYWAGLGNIKDDDVTISASASAAASGTQANLALDAFAVKIRKKPIMMSG